MPPDPFVKVTVKSYAEQVIEAKSRIREVTARETMALVAARPATVVVDCREPNEFNLGRIPGARLIPRGVIEEEIGKLAAVGDTVVIYCASGNRSALAADALQEMGYTDVASMSGGFRGWVEAGGDVDF